MTLVRKTFIPLLCLVLLFIGCKREAPAPAPDRERGMQADTTVLTLALVPNLDCLPFFYARSSGICEAQGVNTQWLAFASQFDCDTAVLGRSAVGGYSDLVRTQYHRAGGAKLTALMGTTGRWALVACGKLRIGKPDKLEKRMVALARFSASDFYCDKVLDVAKLDRNSAFRPQVNDIRERAAMLDENQVDAAILPEPFVTVARGNGHKVLYTVPDTAGLGCLVFKTKALEDKQMQENVRRLFRAYNQAVDSLNQKGKAVCLDVLRSVYGLSPEAIDSLSLPRYKHAALPTDAAVRQAQRFLQQRWSGTMKSPAGSPLLDANYLP